METYLIMAQKIKLSESILTKGVGLLFVIFTILAMCFITVTGHANEKPKSSTEQVHQQQEKVKKQDAKQSDNTQSPDNIVDYALQKIKQDNSTSEKEEPQKPLLAESELSGEYNEAFYVLKSLNSGLPELSTPPNLETPLATLEYFNTTA